MTASQIPDGFSTAQLEELMKQAKENTVTYSGNPEITHIITRVTDTCDELLEELGSFEVYKFIIDYCLFQLTSFHKQGYKDTVKTDPEVAFQWATDATQLQSMAVTLRNIYMGTDDFMHEDNDED